jgi:hypothetical protein
MFRPLIAHHQEVLELCCSIHRFFYNVPSFVWVFWGDEISFTILGYHNTTVVVPRFGFPPVMYVWRSLVSYSCGARGVLCCGGLVFVVWVVGPSCDVIRCGQVYYHFI